VEHLEEEEDLLAQGEAEAEKNPKGIGRNRSERFGPETRTRGKSMKRKGTSRMNSIHERGSLVTT